MSEAPAAKKQKVEEPDFSRARSERLKLLSENTNVFFPVNKLKTNFVSSNPVVLLACGSFSPITNMHLRMFGISNI